MRRLFIAVLALGAASWVNADQPGQYQVTITNLTPGQSFTPQLVATHRRSAPIFELGEPASLGLEILAEGGATDVLTAAIAEGDARSVVTTIPGLLLPGKSVSVVIESRARSRLSIAAMLIPTNDTFMALDAVALPAHGAVTYQAIAYDAGTEFDDQNCLNIPGPRCGGEGYSPGPNEGDEGFVHVSNGFHELAPAQDGEVLSPAAYDWRNPVAMVRVERIR